jgi:hypothetical protein
MPAAVTRWVAQFDPPNLRQHFLVRGDTLKTAGAILAGQDVSVSVF